MALPVSGTAGSRPASDQIEASLDDGVLTVTVPKPERVQPRKVEVKSA
jgi:HSP20 family molecular chaperone IbpA